MREQRQGWPAILAAESWEQVRNCLNEQTVGEAVMPEGHGMRAASGGTSVEGSARRPQGRVGMS